MKKLNLFLVFVMVAIVAKAQNFPTTSWSDVANTSWYNSGNTEFTLSTAEELAGLAQLVLQGNDFEGKTIQIGSDINLDGNLWTPIGVNNINPFSGNVEGNDHSISNLWINLPSADFIGLFGYTSTSTLLNIHLNTSHIVGLDNVGTLVANLFNNGSVENCSAINISVIGNNSTGGLVGGFLTNSSISKSHAIGDVVGSVQVGGLVGTGWDNSQISECYSEGTVTGSVLSGGLVGGFPFGFSGTSIVNNSYSRSSVVASSERAGGLIGGADNGLLVKNSYATGTVSANILAGAIIGLWGNITMENMYFDTESSGMTEGVGGFGGAPVTPDITAKTTAEMKTAEMAELLNRGLQDGPWSINPAENDGYPVLNSTLGISNNILKSASITLFPTLVESNISVLTTSQMVSYSIYNINGMLVLQGNLRGEKDNINASSLSSGMYIVKINTVDGFVSKKVIKK